MFTKIVDIAKGKGPLNPAGLEKCGWGKSGTRPETVGTALQSFCFEKKS